MTRLRLAPLALALMIAAQPAVGAMLRPNVTVEGDVVRLGDLFDDVGPKADVAVARAPAPGKRVTFYSDWLASVANAQGLAWRPASRFEQVLVERAGQTISREQIENELRSALLTQGVPAQAEIEMNGNIEPVVVSAGTPPAIAVHDVSYEARYNRFSADIEIPANTPGSKHLRISGRAYPTVEVPMLAHAVNRGDVLTARDFSFTRIREDTLRRDILTDIDQMIGMAAHQPLRNGQMVATSDIGKPVAVERGALVTMILRDGAMTLSAQARANDSGSIGDSIRVTNTHSNQVVEATVDGPNRVKVPLNVGTLPAN